MCRTDMIQTFVGNQYDHLNMKCSSRALLLTVEASEPCPPDTPDARLESSNISSLFSPRGTGSCRLPFCLVPGLRGRQQRRAGGFRQAYSSHYRRPAVIPLYKSAPGTLKKNELRPQPARGPPSHQAARPRPGPCPYGHWHTQSLPKFRTPRRVPAESLLKRLFSARIGPALWDENTKIDPRPLGH